MSKIILNMKGGTYNVTEQWKIAFGQKVESEKKEMLHASETIIRSNASCEWISIRQQYWYN